MTITIRSILFLLVATLAVDAHAADSVQGSYKANGKDAGLAYAFAYAGEPFSGKPTVELILSEKDTGNSRNAEMPAMFGRFGNALVVKLMKEAGGYSVIGCVFRHTALKATGTSAIGVTEAKNVEMKDGRIRGQLFTNADATLDDEPVVIDLKFDAAVLQE
jgi:hypothetical protein